MTPSRRSRALNVAFFLLAIAAGALWYYQYWIAHQRPHDAGFYYYSGPMRSKGNPNLFATEDGKVVPPPPGTKPLPLHGGGRRPGG